MDHCHKFGRVGYVKQLNTFYGWLSQTWTDWIRTAIKILCMDRFHKLGRNRYLEQLKHFHGPCNKLGGNGYIKQLKYF